MHILPMLEKFIIIAPELLVMVAYQFQRVVPYVTVSPLLPTCASPTGMPCQKPLKQIFLFFHATSLKPFLKIT